MNIQRIAAFCQGSKGGNPAGVLLLDKPLSADDMARIAAEVGFSETAFAVTQGDQDGTHWRVRYFSPESEVPFCGHATIALGAALGRQHGAGTYHLELNDASITVEADGSGESITTTLASPPTRSQSVTANELSDTLELFGLTTDDLDPRLPPARIHGGADHIVLPLRSRERLAAMDYTLEQGKEVMRSHALVTVMLVVIEDDQVFVARNAFASGGVLEDPATGAAAAAFAGYLRDQNWPHAGRLTIRQGEDMGSPSRIEIAMSNVKGTAVRISGVTRMLNHP